MQITFSITEARYISLSTSLSDGISLVLMAKELRKEYYTDMYYDTVDVCFHCFEDNSSALELAQLAKMSHAPNT